MRHRPNQISVTVSDEMRTALEGTAFEHDETLSAALRRIIAQHLRDEGRMSYRAPPSLHLGQTNSRYAARGRT